MISLADICNDCAQDRNPRARRRPPVGRYIHVDGAELDLCQLHVDERLAAGERIRLYDPRRELFPGMTEEEAALLRRGAR